MTIGARIIHPRAALRPCGTDGCPALIRAGERYCLECWARMRRPQGPKPSNAVMGPEDRAIRARDRALRQQVDREESACAACGCDVDTTAAKRAGALCGRSWIMHHKVYRDGPSEREDVCAVCVPCHNGKVHKRGWAAR